MPKTKTNTPLTTLDAISIVARFSQDGMKINEDRMTILEACDLIGKLASSSNTEGHEELRRAMWHSIVGAARSIYYGGEDYDLLMEQGKYAHVNNAPHTPHA